MFRLHNASSKALRLGAPLAAVALLMFLASEVQANAIAVINKSFANPDLTPLNIVASATFVFPPPGESADVEGTVTFTKDVTLAPLLPPMDVQHVLIGDWEIEWQLIKMGFQLDGLGGLIGFDLADIAFGPTGIFDVDLTMLGPPIPGHPSTYIFEAEEPISVVPIDDLFALIPAVPEFAALLSAIVPGSGFVPVATTSLHIIPEPSTAVLLLLGLIGGSIVFSMRRRRAAVVA